MGIRDWLNRLVGNSPPGVDKGSRVEPAAVERRQDRPSTVAFFWGALSQHRRSVYLARVLSTLEHESADDLVLFPWLIHRLYNLWGSEQPRTPVESEVLQCLRTEHFRGRRTPLPPAYCSGRRVVLDDIEWPAETLETVLDTFDPNRCLLTLEPTAEGLAPRKPRTGDAVLWAQQRLRALRSRGAVQVSVMRVQANYRLYEGGDDDHPGVVVFSTAPAPDLEELEELADQIYEARDRPEEPPLRLRDAVELARANTQSWQYHRRARIPPRRAGAQEAYAADLWLPRFFLREGRIVRAHGRGLPCLAEFGKQGGIELLPWQTEAGPPAVLDPAWLTTNEGWVVKIAREIADQGRFTDLPVLADALEDAGCVNQDVLSHCRNPGTHAHGCWVLDLILER